MSESAVIWRMLEFRRRYGFWATVERAGLVLKRCFWNRFVLFCADLDREQGRVDLIERLTIECKTGQGEIGAGDFKRIVNLWQPESIRKQFAERFAKGAVLWL